MIGQANNEVTLLINTRECKGFKPENHCIRVRVRYRTLCEGKVNGSGMRQGKVKHQNCGKVT